jgi:hypothetical protein
MIKSGWIMVAATLLAGGCQSAGMPTGGGTTQDVVITGLRAAELAFAGSASAAETAVDHRLLLSTDARRVATGLQRAQAALLLARAAAVAAGQMDAGAQALAAANDMLAARVVAKLAAAGEA